MDKTGCFLTGVIAGAVALGVTAFLVDGLDSGGFDASGLPEPDEQGEDDSVAGSADPHQTAEEKPAV